MYIYIYIHTYIHTYLLLATFQSAHPTGGTTPRLQPALLRLVAFPDLPPAFHQRGGAFCLSNSSEHSGFYWETQGLSDKCWLNMVFYQEDMGVNACSPASICMQHHATGHKGPSTRKRINNDTKVFLHQHNLRWNRHKTNGFPWIEYRRI